MSDDEKLGWWQVFKSTAMSFLGVQSEAARIRDTQHDNLKPFIVMGILMTIGFVLGLVVVVKVILHFAGV
jgi:hypothetical protein